MKNIASLVGVDGTQGKPMLKIIFPPNITLIEIMGHTLKDTLTDITIGLRKMNKITETIKKTLNNKTENPYAVAKVLSDALAPFQYYGYSNNTLLELMLGHHMLNSKDFYFDFAKLLYAKLSELKIKSFWFGDYDDVIELIHDTPKKKVFLFHDTCTCADINKWILVWDIEENREYIHVREIHNKSDYPRSQYPKKLNVNFYKKRKFIIDYVDEYHMTKLGGVYGDIRDIGYVISYEKYSDAYLNRLREIVGKEFEDAISGLGENDTKHLFHYYSEWASFTNKINRIKNDIDEDEYRI